MTIPNTESRGKEIGHLEASADPSSGIEGQGGGIWDRLASDWLLWVCIVLSGTLCYGLALLLAKENDQKGDLWIEQLPESVLPGIQPAAGESASAVE